jgi:hypothetical protein
MSRTLGLLGALAVLGFTLPPNILIQPDSKVWVTGDSTVRGFTCLAQEVQGTVEPGPNGGALGLQQLGSAVGAVEVRVPVLGLDCGNGTMDGHMQKALKASDHGTIVFRLKGYDASVPAAGKSTLTLRGTLSLAGAEQPVSIKATATQEADGTLRVEGSQEITMSEWGVKPPSLMLGTMKVRDQVTVNFDIRLRQQ